MLVWENKEYFKKTSTYNDLFLDADLAPFAKHLASYANKESLIFDKNSPWPNEEMLKSLSWLKEMTKNKKVIYKELPLYSSFLLMKQEKKDAPLAIILGGGGYEKVCTLPEALPVARRFYLEGYNAITFSYPTRKFAIKALPSLIDLVSYLKEHQEELGISINNYLLGGFSAAGHLVGEFASDNFGYMKHNLPKPSLIFLGYPVISMMREYTHLGSRDALLGKNPSKEIIEEYSLEKHVSKDYPSTFIWACKDDNVVNSKNSLLLSEALAKENIDHELLLFPGNVHGYGIGNNTSVEPWFYLLMKFLKKEI